MKQKIVLNRKQPSKELPKSLQDTKQHNFTVYYCLKDAVGVNIKPLIMFAKSKDSRLKNIKIIDITDVTKKDYPSKVYCILLNCDSTQYVVFKHYLYDAMKKYLTGGLEATQKDIEKVLLKEGV